MFGLGNYYGMYNPMYGMNTNRINIPVEHHSIEAYSSKGKDDTAIKIMSFGALAIMAGALILRGSRQSAKAAGKIKEKISNFTRAQIKARAKSINNARKIRLENEAAALKVRNLEAKAANEASINAAKQKLAEQRAAEKAQKLANKKAKAETKAPEAQGFSKKEIKNRAKSILEARKNRIAQEKLEQKTLKSINEHNRAKLAKINEAKVETLKAEAPDKPNFSKKEIKNRAKSILEARKNRIAQEKLEQKTLKSINEHNRAKLAKINEAKVETLKAEAPDKPNFSKKEIKNRAKSILEARKNRIAQEELEQKTLKSINEHNRAKLAKINEAKVETPKVETPKVETPKVETPKVEIPKVEIPKVEIPKVEIPKVKTPKVENTKIISPYETNEIKNTKIISPYDVNQVKGSKIISPDEAKIGKPQKIVLLNENNGPKIPLIKSMEEAVSSGSSKPLITVEYTAKNTVTRLNDVAQAQRPKKKENFFTKIINFGK